MPFLVQILLRIFSLSMSIIWIHRIAPSRLSIAAGGPSRLLVNSRTTSGPLYTYLFNDYIVPDILAAVTVCLSARRMNYDNGRVCPNRNEIIYPHINIELSFEEHECSGMQCSRSFTTLHSARSPSVWMKARTVLLFECGLLRRVLHCRTGVTLG